MATDPAAHGAETPVEMPTGGATDRHFGAPKSKCPDVQVTDGATFGYFGDRVWSPERRGESPICNTIFGITRGGGREGWGSGEAVRL